MVSGKWGSPRETECPPLSLLFISLSTSFEGTASLTVVDRAPRLQRLYTDIKSGQGTRSWRVEMSNGQNKTPSRLEIAAMS
ncbi:hypothetical protein D3C74_08080 [compost metagenome]